MARRIREEDLRAIEEVVGQRPDGMTTSGIMDALQAGPPRRTLQYRLKALFDAKRLIRDGSGRWARYRLPKGVSLSTQTDAGLPRVTTPLTTPIPLSKSG